MIGLATSPSISSSSRRRFVTFGGALILAACLTLVKMTLVAFDVNDQDLLDWPATPWPEATDEPAAMPGAILADANTSASPPSDLIDDSQFVPWPTLLPEPAAGPPGRNEGQTGGMAESDDAPAVGDGTLPFDPSTLTQGQITALQQLAARRQELEERERLLDMRAELNGRTEERLDQQIAQLTELKERIQALVTDLDEAEEQKLARLVKIYETMKPKAAAEIFNRLDIPVLLHVVERMKEAKSAVVLGKMNPAIAKRVTTELARRKERPGLGGQGLGS